MNVGKVNVGHCGSVKSQLPYRSPTTYTNKQGQVRGFAIGSKVVGKKEKKPEEPVPDLVQVPWLQEQIRFGKVKVLDATWGNGRTNWREDYVKKRIAGAAFFDLERHSDTSRDLPHMIPKPIPYEKAMEELGLTHKDHIVIYDRGGEFMASARIWWQMKVYGHKKVSVLAGGFGAWEKGRGQVESGEPPAPRPRGRCKSNMFRELIADMRAVNQASEGRGQLVDSRPPARFNGTEPEPRTNVRSGHITGAVNIPFTDMMVPLGDGPEKTFPSKEQIEEIFRKKGINPDERMVLMSGSGISAAALCFALHLAGKTRWSLYDGSWAEYGRIAPPGPAAHG